MELSDTLPLPVSISLSKLKAKNIKFEKTYLFKGNGRKEFGNQLVTPGLP